MNNKLFNSLKKPYKLIDNYINVWTNYAKNNDRTIDYQRALCIVTGHPKKVLEIYIFDMSYLRHYKKILYLKFFLFGQNVKKTNKKIIDEHHIKYIIRQEINNKPILFIYNVSEAKTQPFYLDQKIPRSVVSLVNFDTVFGSTEASQYTLDGRSPLKYTGDFHNVCWTLMWPRRVEFVTNDKLQYQLSAYSTINRFCKISIKKLYQNLMNYTLNLILITPPSPIQEMSVINSVEQNGNLYYYGGYDYYRAKQDWVALTQKN